MFSKTVFSLFLFVLGRLLIFFSFAACFANFNLFARSFTILVSVWSICLRRVVRFIFWNDSSVFCNFSLYKLI